MKGISPLIAAVLLIAFTMAIAALVGVFGTTFSKGETEKISSSAQCVGALQIDPLSIRFSQITRRVTGRITNYGKSTLDNFLVTVYYPDSTTITRNITDNITAGSSKALSIHTGNSKNPEKVSVFAENCGPSYSASLKISSDKIINGRYDYTMDPNIIGCWNFENVVDIGVDSCNNNNLTNTNGVGQNTTNYMEGSASGDFDGNNDEYLSCTNNDCPNLDISSSISYGCWARVTDDTQSNVIIEKEAGNSGYQLLRDTTVDRARCRFGDSSTLFSANTADTSFSLNTFYHLVCVFDDINDKGYIYMDADIKDNPQIQTLVSTSNSFSLSTGDFSGSDLYGQLDECFVFNRALNEKEICEICRFGLDGKHADRGAQCSNCGYV